MNQGSFSCGLYPNSTPQTIQYVAENTKANIIVVDTEEQYAKIRRVKHCLLSIVLK
jgi:long-subunit acyl-CoA synthetase (AMP-forming)